MKTTIEIADDLISRAKLVQKRKDVTLRALVEEGLRVVLDRDATSAPYKFVPVVAGIPWTPGMSVPDVNALIAESNDRAWVRRRSGDGEGKDRMARGKVIKHAKRRKRT